MTPKELQKEKQRLETAIADIEFTINAKIKKGETDVGAMYARINVLDEELKSVNSRLHHHFKAGSANTNENEKKAASIIAGSNIELRPSQHVRVDNMPVQQKIKKKDTKDCPVIPHPKAAIVKRAMAEHEEENESA